MPQVHKLRLLISLRFQYLDSHLTQMELKFANKMERSLLVKVDPVTQQLKITRLLEILT